MLFSENRKKNINYEFDYALKFNYGKLVPKNEIGDVSSLKETYMAYTIINKNDIAINCLNLNYDFVSQRVAISPQKGIITSAYLIITPRQGVEAMYFNYLFKAMDSKKLFHGMGTGIRLTLSFSELKKQQIPVPPLPEQEAIVTYLDTKVAKIDEYISIAEKKIAALEELKQTIIAEAVTRGIHKDVPMKDSGVKWIGMIPAHWNTVSLKRTVSLINEKSNEQGVPYIGLENIESYSGKILPLSEIEPDSICNKFKKGDVLFSKLRPYLTKCVSPSFDGKCTSELLVLRDFKGIDKYLKYILLSPKLVMDINASTYGAKMPRASWNYIGQCPIPIPPIEEQQEIVTYIEAKAAKIDQLCQAERSQIEKLKEYKQRLISDVVTGKVKVMND